MYRIRCDTRDLLKLYTDEIVLGTWLRTSIFRGTYFFTLHIALRFSSRWTAVAICFHPRLAKRHYRYTIVSFLLKPKINCSAARPKCNQSGIFFILCRDPRGVQKACNDVCNYYGRDCRGSFPPSCSHIRQYSVCENVNFHRIDIYSYI